MKANIMNTKTLIAGALAVSALCASVVAVAQQPSVSRQIFVAADLDKDGFVDIAEFHNDVVRAFHVLDHNRDGYISVDEIRSIPDKTRVDFLLGALKRADKDGDGRLSFKEVVEVRMAYFDAADGDGDERLSLAEVIAYDDAAARRARVSLAAPAKAR